MVKAEGLWRVSSQYQEGALDTGAGHNFLEEKREHICIYGEMPCEVCVWRQEGDFVQSFTPIPSPEGHLSSVPVMMHGSRVQSLTQAKHQASSRTVSLVPTSSPCILSSPSSFTSTSLPSSLSSLP